MSEQITRRELLSGLIGTGVIMRFREQTSGIPPDEKLEAYEALPDIDKIQELELGLYFTHYRLCAVERFIEEMQHPTAMPLPEGNL